MSASGHLIQFLGNFNHLNNEYIHLLTRRRKCIPRSCDFATTFICCRCNRFVCTNCNRHSLPIRDIKGKIDDKLAICNLCAIRKIFNPLGEHHTDADIFLEFLNGIKDIFRKNSNYLECDDNCGFNMIWQNLRKYNVKFSEVVFYDVATRNICMNNPSTPLYNLCVHCKYVRFTRCDYDLLASIFSSYTYIPTYDNLPFDAQKQSNLVRWNGSEVYISSVTNWTFLKYVECDRSLFDPITHYPNGETYRDDTLDYNHMDKLNCYEDIYADYVLSKYYNNNSSNTSHNKLYYKKLYIFLNTNMLCELRAMALPEHLFSDYFVHHTRTKFFNNHIHINTINDQIFITELNKFKQTNNHRFCVVITIDSTCFCHMAENVIRLDATNRSIHKVFATKYAIHINDYLLKMNVNYRCVYLYPDNDYAKMLLKTSLYLSTLNLNKQWMENMFIVNDQVIVLSTEENLAHNNMKQILSHVCQLKNYDTKSPDDIGKRMTWNIKGKIECYDLRQHSLVSADHQTIIYSDVIRRCFFKWMNILYRPISGSRYLSAKIDFENMSINV